MENDNKGSIWILIVSLFFPLIGLALYIAWHSTKPGAAKKAGIGSIVGTVIGLIIGLVFTFVVPVKILFELFNYTGENSIVIMNMYTAINDEADIYSDNEEIIIKNRIIKFQEDNNYDIFIYTTNLKSSYFTFEEYYDKFININLGRNSYNGLIVIIDSNSNTAKIEDFGDLESILSSDKLDQISSSFERTIVRNNYATAVENLLLSLENIITPETDNTSNFENTNDDYAYSNDVKTWHEKTQEDEYVVTLLALSTCGACIDYKPVINKVAQDNNIILYVFNINELPDTDTTPLMNIYELTDYSGGFPFTFITKNGKYISGKTGGMNDAALLEFLRLNNVLN